MIYQKIIVTSFRSRVRPPFVTWSLTVEKTDDYDGAKNGYRDSHAHTHTPEHECAGTH